MDNARMKFARSGHSGATINIGLKGRTTLMRYVSNTQRVNLSRLFGDMQIDGSISIKHMSTKQQCADIFNKFFTDAEMWNVLVPISGVFDMNH